MLHSTGNPGNNKNGIFKRRENLYVIFASKLVVSIIFACLILEKNIWYAI